MQEYGLSGRLVKKAKEILRNYRGRRTTERFSCDVCRIVHDLGWVYECGDGDFHICPLCRNKCLPGKMQQWRLRYSSFESDKKRH